MDQLNDMQMNYQSLLESGHLSDVTVVVGGKEFQLHKTVLAARSPVFLAMFTNNCKEAIESRVTIDDITVDVFEELIGFIYSGVTPNLASHPMELHIAADKYQLGGLTNRCSTFLASHLTVETAGQILHADMHNGAELKKKCLSFIVKYAKDVRATVGWQRFKDAKRVDLMDELIGGLLESQPNEPLIKKKKKESPIKKRKLRASASRPIRIGRQEPLHDNEIILDDNNADLFDSYFEYFSVI